MPTYDFQCEKCGNIQEIFLRFSEKMPEKVQDLDTICCKEDSLVYQIFHPPSAHVTGNTTIGGLAESNSKKLGKDRIAQLDAEYRTKKTNTLQLNEGMSIANTPSVSREKMKQINQINKMTTVEKKRYIEKGK